MLKESLNILLVSCESQEILQRDKFPTERKLYEILSQKRNDLVFSEVDVQKEKYCSPDHYDGIIVWGSSSSVLKEEARMENLRGIIKRTIELDKPLLWVCFWAQVLATLLWADIYSNSVWEFGIVSINLTDFWYRDLLFDSLERRVNVISAHQDSICTGGLVWEVLAKNGYSDCQSFSYGRWIRGVQFHPEYSISTLNHLEKILWFECSSDEVHDGEKIIENFLNHFVYKKKYL